MGTLQVNGNISATGTIQAASFLGNATSATRLQTERTIQTNLASTTGASFDGTANITPGITGILPITNGGTGANDRKTAITNLGVFGLYSREDIGTSPNFDNPGVNGLFEMREKTETPGETGTKPFNGYAPFISLRYSNTMFQLAGINGSGFYIRGIQTANPTLTGTAWQRILTSDNYTDYTITKTGSGASGTWGINITGNAATASKITPITTEDAASNSAVWRRIWMGYANNTEGRPAYDDRFAIQTSTGTLKAPIFSGSLSGNASSANLLSIHNTLTATSTRSTSASSWNGVVSGLNYVWGQSFKDTAISSDTGDLVLGLRSGQYTSNSTELCMMIDGDYYAMGNKVLHTGDWKTTTVNPTALNNAITNGCYYVNNTGGLFGYTDGVCWSQGYNSSWVTQIFQDYRTGQIAVRSKNNGTWMPWRPCLYGSSGPLASRPESSYIGAVYLAY